MSSTFGRPFSPIAACAQIGSSLLGAREQILVAIEIERGEPGGAGERMRRIGVAVEQLDRRAPGLS